MTISRKLLAGAGAGAIALSLAAAGGYMAHAGIAADGAVNAHPIAAAATPNTFADIIQRVAPAVVSIEVEGRRGPQAIGLAPDETSPFADPDDSDSDGLPFDLRRFFGPGLQAPSRTPFRGAGSGFFISRDGYLVTNNHVVAGAERITVHTADDRTLKAQVVGRDPATDLAVLKVQATGVPFVSFEDRAKPRVGDWVVAIGNPFNLGGTATAGIVSALGRRGVSDSNYVDYMQIDAPINRGNSGGPTFDLEGRVVGVNTAIFTPSGGSVGIGFDIPADVVASVSKQLIAKGRVSRGYIGATVQDVTPDIAESLGLTGKGALVAEVVPGGPAEAAGLRSGDLILKVDGQPVAGAADVTRQVAQDGAGASVRLEVRRDGQTRQIAVTSGVRPSEEALAASDGAFTDGHGSGASALGLRVAPQASGQGVRVTGVAPGSDAASKGLRPGDVIVQAGALPVQAPADLARAVKTAQAGGKPVLLLVARGHQHIFVPVAPAEG
ncbi:Do family serine endopeptidase [Phenylobacterium sp.]|uniref:Do family serine endopeptidase n=1 Tax=Phenylobacterium sp. TaxID=1871053 RepID=UPI00120A8D99|nr:Do family serine endopeptidase [Phenylobacterium sp.]THD63008.1 MAG: Do family serine endopeptidase [Phenylobacterium sp.]